MIFVNVQGERVPALGLGTWRLYDAACTEAVEHALDIGYRHVDTAQSYENEEAVGEGLRNADVDRAAIFLTTKLWIENLTPSKVRQSAEASLRRLGSEYVDLLLIHWPVAGMDLAGALGALMTLHEEGKVRHVGVSNFTPSLIREALEHAPVYCNQVEYHPFLSQEKLRRLAQEYDFMLTAYSPIARNRVSDDAAIREMAERHGKSPVQVTLRWLIQQENVAAIPKAASRDHRERNFDLFDFALSDGEMDALFSLARGERLINPAFAPDWEH